MMKSQFTSNIIRPALPALVSVPTDYSAGQLTSNIKKLTLLLCLYLIISVLQAQTKNQIRYVSEENNQSLKVEYDGKITIGPDDRTIQSISNGGYLRIEKTTFGNSRELFVNSNGNNLNFEYKEGGRTKPFEPDGRTWLADVLPELLRSTGIAAESRVDRLYNQGGVRQVIQELTEMKSDHVKAKYLELLLAKNANQNETNQIMAAVGEHVKSDHYRYEIFKKNHETLFSSPANQTQYLKTVQMIKSDHYKSLLLKEVVKKQPQKAQQQQVIDLIGTIESDHYKSEIIRDLAKRSLSNEEMKSLVNNTVATISSDHYKTEIIRDLAKRPLSEEELKSLLDNSIATISSDHYRNEVLSAILKNQSLGENQVLLLVKSAGLLQSDHYKSEFLKNVCRVNSTEKVKASIRETAKTIKSTHYFGEIMRCASN